MTRTEHGRKSTGRGATTRAWRADEPGARRTDAAVLIRLLLGRVMPLAAIAVSFLAACNNGNGGGAPGY